MLLRVWFFLFVFKVFEKWLASQGSLDAVTLWFSGVHKALSKTELADFFDVKSDADHRECVEDASMQLGARFLRAGGARGIVQIVSRAGFPDERAAVSEFTSVYGPIGDDVGMRLRSIRSYRYEETTNANSIQVRSLERSVDALPSYAMSMTFEKIG